MYKSRRTETLRDRGRARRGSTFAVAFPAFQLRGQRPSSPLRNLVSRALPPVPSRGFILTRPSSAKCAPNAGSDRSSASKARHRAVLVDAFFLTSASLTPFHRPVVSSPDVSFANLADEPDDLFQRSGAANETETGIPPDRPDAWPLPGSQREQPERCEVDTERIRVQSVERYDGEIPHESISVRALGILLDRSSAQRTRVSR